MEKIFNEIKYFLKTLACFLAASLLVPVLLITFLFVHYSNELVNYVLSIKYPQLSISKTKKIRSLIDTRRNAGIFNFLIHVKGACDFIQITKHFEELLTNKREKTGKFKFPKLRQQLVNCWGHYGWVKDSSSFNINNHILLNTSPHRGYPVCESNIQDFVSDLVTKYIPSELPQWQVIVIPAATKVAITNDGNDTESYEEEHYYMLLKIHHLIIAEEDDLHISEMLMLQDESDKPVIEIGGISRTNSKVNNVTYFIRRPEHIENLLKHIGLLIINQWNKFIYEFESLETPDGTSGLKITNISQLLSVLLIITVNVIINYCKCMKAKKQIALRKFPEVEGRYKTIIKLLGKEIDKRHLSWRVANEAVRNSLQISNITKTWLKIVWHTNVNSMMSIPYHTYREVVALKDILFKGETSLSTTYCGRVSVYLPMIIYAQMEFLKICYELYKAPVNIYEELFEYTSKEENKLQKMSYSGRKIVSFSKTIDAKEIRQRLTFSDEIRESDFTISCLSAAIYDYFKLYSNDVAVPKILNTTCRVMAKGYFTDNMGDKTDYIGGVVFLQLPLKVPDREHTRQIHSIVERIRRKQVMIYLTSIGQTKYDMLTGIFPSVLTKICINYFSSNFPVTITEIHGENSEFQTLWGQTVIDVLLFRPPQSKTCEEENEKVILDLSRKQLKKVPKQEDAQNVRTLLLEENELQKIDNIDSYLKIEKLSLSKNQLLRMYGVCRLHCLRDLNLSFNGILSIEGLKECVHLRYLNLEGNNIKTIEHLNTNLKLEFLNLAENSIGSVSDISFLKSLKELYLHGNRLTHLRQCDKYLPISLEVLTLAKNNISDLNEICTLTNLNYLNSFTINDNPCVSMTSGADGFDHRPFVLNWCLCLKVIDGFVVDPIESLKAEWLYSQGRGRSFRLGEQAALAKYLSSVCPLIGKALENENERKLRLILSKAQHHQRQLQEEISENSNPSANNSPSSGRKKPTSRIQSPRFSRLSGRQGSPDSMVNSYHGNTTSEQVANANHLMQMTTSLIENIKNNDSLMSQSLDVSNVISSNSKMINSQESTPRTTTPNPYNGGPLNAASKMVPVPETLMSPDVCPVSVAQRVTVSAINTQIQQTKTNKNKDNRLSSPKMRSPRLKRNSAERSPTMSPRKTNSLTSTTNTPHHLQQHGHTKSVANLQHGTHMLDHQMKSRQFISNSMHLAAPGDCSAGASSDEDSDNINVDKLKTIHNKAAQRCQQIKQNTENYSHNCSPDTETSAIVIQKIWRGYRTRKKTKDIAEKLLKKRTHEYIDKLTKDMEMTKAQLENERKIQQLQMQAINALWKKVSSMQNTSVNAPGNDGQKLETSSSATSATAAVVSQQNQNTLSLDNSSTMVVNDLAKTCTMLTSQVQQLQGSMRDILNCLTLFCNLPQENVKRLLTAGVAEALSNGPDSTTATSVEKRDSAATQTEIVAVHTPQLENQSNFPFTKIRPSTLPLIESQRPHTPTNSTANITTDMENSVETPTNRRMSLEESGVASAEDGRSSNDSVSFLEKQDEDEKHKLNASTNLSG